MTPAWEYTLPVIIPDLLYFRDHQPFTLESGYTFQNGITIGYHTYGALNAEKNNVIWVCHALTANSHVEDWWSGLFGEGKVLDPSRYFIVCANVLGSCYGTTGARSADPVTNQPYGVHWPLVTIRDWVSAHDVLRAHLGIEQIHLCIGGSCGGHQVLEYAIMHPHRIHHIALIATSARESAWAIAGHEAQRLALRADISFQQNTNDAGQKGLMAARGIALLGYRTSEAYILTQTDEDDVLRDHRASTYIRYQGEKLRNRFYAHCYDQLLRALDTHHAGRGRISMEVALKGITSRAIVIAIDSDRLIPSDQQAFLAEHIPQATFHLIPSAYGHDGFLIETETIGKIIRDALTRV